MKLTTKDTVGWILVAGTLATLLLHNAPLGHRDTHVQPVAAEGGSLTSAAEVKPVVLENVGAVPIEAVRLPLRPTPACAESHVPDRCVEPTSALGEGHPAVSRSDTGQARR